MLTRRTFLLGSIATGTSAYFGFRRRHFAGTLLSAFEDARGDQYIGGAALESGEVFGAKIPVRAHGCAVDPTDAQRVLFFARRPGTQAFELRRDSLKVREAFSTQPGRHLAGHGLFSQDGRWLLTPENDYENVRGVIVVRDARNFSIAGEIDTHGIDPHEVGWLNDTSLLVANGGIRTHPRTFRRKLNIPTMDPSLCVIDAASGKLREQCRLPDHLLSIRHMAVGSNGVAALGLQYEGKRQQAPGVAALYRTGAGLKLLPAAPAELAQFRGYVASIVLSEQQDRIAAACPYGNGVACWSLSQGSYVGFLPAGETYGLSRLEDGTLVASQRDGSAYALSETRLRSHFLELTASQPIRWDDHWVALG